MKKIAAALTVFLCVSPSAWAADCSLQLLNMVPLTVADNVAVVPVVINGTEHRFAFDTAARLSQMTPQAARELGLPVSSGAAPAKITGTGVVAFAMSTKTRGAGAGLPSGASIDAPDPTEIYNAAGVRFGASALVRDLQFGSMKNADMPLLVTDFPPSGTIGLLNGDLFRQYDIDLNFHASRFDTFSSNHCPGQVLYWRAPGVAALPMLYRDNRITVHVSVDGKDLRAVIDTGSSHSEMKLDAATRLFGIAPDSPGVTLKQPAAMNDRDRYSYDFRTLSFGPVAVGHPHLLLTRDILVRGANPNAPTGSLIRGNIADEPDMVIGTDILKLLHVYIAFGERTLYVTQGPELAEGDKTALPTVPVTPFRP